MHNCQIPEPLSDRAAEISRLRFLANKVSMVHGPQHPDMAELSKLLTQLAITPMAPVSPEERKQLEMLTNGYQPWEGACGSVRALFAGVRALSDAPAGVTS